MTRFFESLSDPHARHAMLVHLPIVVGVLGFVPVLFLLVTRMKSRALLAASVGLFALASAAALLAASAGEDAEERVEKVGLTAVEKAALHKHEELGENGWIWPLIPAAALVGAGFFTAPRPRMALGAIALAGALGVGGWVALTAHTGGELVYTHGLGTPTRGAGAPSTPPNDAKQPTEQRDSKPEGRDHHD